MKTRRRFLSAVLGGAAAVVVSCSDPSPVGVGSRALGPQAHFVDTVLQTIGTYTRGLVKCSPLPYDSVSKTIGPQGDTLQVGPHTLRVPAGALSAPVTITAVAPSDSVNRVDFQPEGLTFAQPASLVMSYANCDISAGQGNGPQTFPGGMLPGPTLPGLPPPPPPAATPPVLTPPGPPLAGPTVPEPALQGQANRPPLRLAHITDALEIIEYLESADDTASQKVTGRLDHFSDYAIAW